MCKQWLKTTWSRWFSKLLIQRKLIQFSQRRETWVHTYTKKKFKLINLITEYCPSYMNWLLLEVFFCITYLIFISIFLQGPSMVDRVDRAQHVAICGIQVSRRVSRLPYVELHNQGKVCVAFILGELLRRLVWSYY